MSSEVDFAVLDCRSSVRRRQSILQYALFDESILSGRIDGKVVSCTFGLIHTALSLTLGNTSKIPEIKAAEFNFNHGRLGHIVGWTR